VPSGFKGAGFSDSSIRLSHQLIPIPLRGGSKFRLEGKTRTLHKSHEECGTRDAPSIAAILRKLLFKFNS
jgi:hypothetical protein